MSHRSKLCQEINEHEFWRPFQRACICEGRWWLEFLDRFYWQKNAYALHLSAARGSVRCFTFQLSAPNGVQMLSCSSVWLLSLHISLHLVNIVLLGIHRPCVLLLVSSNVSYTIEIFYRASVLYFRSESGIFTLLVFTIKTHYIFFRDSDTIQFIQRLLHVSWSDC